MQDFFCIRNWPKQLIQQLILSNLSDGNSLKVINNFQHYPPTLIAYKKCVTANLFDTNIRKFDAKKTIVFAQNA